MGTTRCIGMTAWSRTEGRGEPAAGGTIVSRGRSLGSLVEQRLLQYPSRDLSEPRRNRAKSNVYSPRASAYLSELSYSSWEFACASPATYSGIITKSNSSPPGIFPSIGMRSARKCMSAMVASNPIRILNGSKYRYGIRPLEVDGKKKHERR